MTVPKGKDPAPAMTSGGVSGEANDYFGPVPRRTLNPQRTVRLVEMLHELATARARLVDSGLLDLHEAVDGLQRLAEAWGLLDAIGQDSVQEILAAPFAGASAGLEAAA